MPRSKRKALSPEEQIKELTLSRDKAIGRAGGLARENKQLREARDEFRRKLIEATAKIGVLETEHEEAVKRWKAREDSLKKRLAESDRMLEAQMDLRDEIDPDENER